MRICLRADRAPPMCPVRHPRGGTPVRSEAGPRLRGTCWSYPTAGNVMRAAPERRTVASVACLALAVVCCACACTAAAAADHAGGAGQHGAVITVGSFDFPESVLLADIYADALTAQGFPVRVLPDLGARELVDPALMSGLVQVVPEYSGSALEFVSLGRQSATSDVTATGRALAELGGWPGAGGGAPVRRAGRQRHRGHRRDRGPLWPAIGRRPGPGGAAAGVRRSARMPGARLLPARAEAGVRAPVPVSYRSTPGAR